MVYHITFRIGATDTWTGISALLIEASQIHGTIRVGYAFGSAVGWCSDEAT